MYNQRKIIHSRKFSCNKVTQLLIGKSYSISKDRVVVCDGKLMENFQICYQSASQPLLPPWIPAPFELHYTTWLRALCMYKLTFITTIRNCAIAIKMKLFIIRQRFCNGLSLMYFMISLGMLTL